MFSNIKLVFKIVKKYPISYSDPLAVHAVLIEWPEKFEELILK